MVVIKCCVCKEESYKYEWKNGAVFVTILEQSQVSLERNYPFKNRSVLE